MLRFFPFAETYDPRMGARGLKPGEPLCEVDLEHYTGEVRLKRRLLGADPGDYFIGGPGTLAAQWEALAIVLENLVACYPDDFSLERQGAAWHWRNRLLQEQQAFQFNEDSSLPFEPLDWVGRQVQEDLLLVSAGERLPLLGGQLCFANDWSIGERLGKSFLEIHARLPETMQPSVNAGARLLENMKAGKTVWRLNWSFKLSAELDLSTKHRARYAVDFAARAPRLTPESAGREVFLRVERQTITRLPGAAGILFGIHTYNSRLQDEAADPERARRMFTVLRETPQQVYLYKEIAPIAGVIQEFLETKVSNLSEEY